MQDMSDRNLLWSICKASKRGAFFRYAFFCIQSEYGGTGKIKLGHLGHDVICIKNNATTLLKSSCNNSIAIKNYERH